MPEKHIFQVGGARCTGPQHVPLELWPDLPGVPRGKLHEARCSKGPTGRNIGVPMKRRKTTERNFSIDKR